MSKLNYPFTRASDQTDNYHGTLVSDPYRWLEDTDAPDTHAWIAAQNKLTLEYLAHIPARERLRQRLTELWDYPKAFAPLKRGGRYFQLRNTGLQNQDVLFVMPSPNGEARVLLDPNTLSADGTLALTGWAASGDGQWLVYGVSASGSDWRTWRVRDIATGQDLPDAIEWSKFSSAAWRTGKAEGVGFYYARYAAPAPGESYTGVNYNQQLYFHRLGQMQAEDALIYERPDQPEWGFEPTVSDDGRYLILTVWHGTDVRNRVFYQDLAVSGPTVELISELEAGYHFVGNAGPVFYFRTDHQAPRGQLIAIDTAQPDQAQRRTLIPETEDVLESVTMANNQFVALYLHDAHNQLKLFSLEGQPAGEIALPTFGAIGRAGYELNLHGQSAEAELFYSFNSFLHPVTAYRYDFMRGVSETLFAPSLPFEATPYITRQVFVPSKDGTRVPLFLTHHRDIKLDGSHPTLLYGYGGFNLALTPSFMVSRLAWLELGGVLAVANLRGGGEYGETWHQAGMLHHKQNVFDDFIACAEYLIADGITSQAKLAIQGGSNGGLLVGACLTQRPDLFGAAIPMVGVMDMLRFHKFTIGWAWVSDYGCADDPEQFKTLYAYSPLHTLKPGAAYPATLITTGDHDDRVVPGHSFKFAAALQAAQAGDAPTLIRVQTKAGHGLGKPTAILIEEQADIWAFLVKALNLEL